MERDVLVIIDLQYDFTREWDKVVGACARLGRRLAKKGWLPVILEYDNSGDTHDIVRNAVPEAVYVDKNSDGGGREVKAMLRGMKVTPRTFKVCGVNTAACVQSTVEQLSDLYPEAKIEVVANCCANIDCYGQSFKIYHIEALEQMASLKNVVVKGPRLGAMEPNTEE